MLAHFLGTGCLDFYWIGFLSLLIQRCKKLLPAGNLFDQQSVPPDEGKICPTNVFFAGLIPDGSPPNPTQTCHSRRPRPAKPVQALLPAPAPASCCPNGPKPPAPPRPGTKKPPGVTGRQKLFSGSTTFRFLSEGLESIFQDGLDYGLSGCLDLVASLDFRTYLVLFGLGFSCWFSKV